MLTLVKMVMFEIKSIEKSERDKKKQMKMK
jgi:hypothetical protein